MQVAQMGTRQLSELLLLLLEVGGNCISEVCFSSGRCGEERATSKEE